MNINTYIKGNVDTCHKKEYKYGEIVSRYYLDLSAIDQILLQKYALLTSIWRCIHWRPNTSYQTYQTIDRCIRIPTETSLSIELIAVTSYKNLSNISLLSTSVKLASCNADKFLISEIIVKNKEQHIYQYIP